MERNNYVELLLLWKWEWKCLYCWHGTFSPDSNCITSDPMFVGTSFNPAHPYSIFGISPFVDAGNNDYNAELYDIRRTEFSRKLDKTSGGGGIIDIGAYEYKVGVDPYSFVSVKDVERLVPKEFALMQNYPNPFNPTTIIKYDIPNVGTQHFVSLKIYDILGKEVAILLNEQKPAGSYEVQFNASQLASGVYFYL